MAVWIAWKNKPPVCILSISEQLIVFAGLTLLLRFLKIAGMQCHHQCLTTGMIPGAYYVTKSSGRQRQ